MISPMGGHVTDECKQYSKTIDMDIKSEQSLIAHDEGSNDSDDEASDESDDGGCEE